MMRTTIVRLLPTLVLVCLFAAGSGCTSRSDISGAWKGKMTLAETGKSITDLEFEFQQTSKALAGTLAFTAQTDGNMKLKGERNGDEVTFTTEHKKGLTMSFTGRVKDHSRIEGTALLAYSDPKVPVRQDTVMLELTRK